MDIVFGMDEWNCDAVYSETTLLTCSPISARLDDSELQKRKTQLFST